MEALLLIPAAAAKNLSKSIKGFVSYSVIFALISCLLGVYLPIHFDISIPSGGAIILISSVIFIITTVVRMLFKNFAEGE
ncbi:metal cation ABC superfamily ATP binding cassette transporter, ABC protein [Fusobacterium animalis ATCC 51191]|uniref:Metal cation ABC superfamily ATP binding cassette transporter, ABC protein n=1 Tax=Fusobacterium animalis ATCC 51191 TaxID=997347 RepID=F9ERE4_9FUSO|nr:metal cation ABC superfamily ATP binding cassette transporter, ABC protein [Fusobacterium animalis ATCC 51191]